MKVPVHACHACGGVLRHDINCAAVWIRAHEIRLDWRERLAMFRRMREVSL